MWHGPCTCTYVLDSVKGEADEIRSYLALLGVAAFSVFAIGCESAEEVGENIQELGDDIEDAAD